MRPRATAISYACQLCSKRFVRLGETAWSGLGRRASAALRTVLTMVVAFGDVWLAHPTGRSPNGSNAISPPRVYETQTFVMVNQCCMTFRGEPGGPGGMNAAYLMCSPRQCCHNIRGTDMFILGSFHCKMAEMKGDLPASCMTPQG